MNDAGTGSPGSESVGQDAVAQQIAQVAPIAAEVAVAPGAEAVPPASLMSEAADINDEEADDTAVAEDADLCEYARTLGLDPEQDADLLWVAQEAFGAPLPGSWAEYADETGRVYYFHDASSKTTWEHPMDEVFRELLDLVKETRGRNLRQAQAHSVVKEHLQQAHRRALTELQVWSGPYPSEQGEYYYNEELKASTWESPITEWQNELTLRHDVLTRCLLGDRDPSEHAGGDEPGFPQAGDAPAPGSLLDSLRLPLGLVRRESLGREVPGTPSTSRTFYTARSAASSRSKHSAKSDKRHKKERRHKGEDSRSKSTRHYEETTPGLPLQPHPSSGSHVFQVVD